MIDIGIEIEKEVANCRSLAALFTEMDSKVKESEKKIQDLSAQELDYQKQAFEVESSVGLLTKFFRKSKYQSALELSESLRVKAQECKSSAFQVLQIVDDERMKANKCSFNKDAAFRKLQESKERLRKLQEKQSTAHKRIIQLKEEIDATQSTAEAEKIKCESQLKNYLHAGDMKTGKVLDEVFIENLLSQDDEVGTKAQITNPWSTEEFNREREKLFYLALQMTKEFLLSSKSCRANLCILGQYWGLRTESGTDKIKFHKQDSEAMIGSLFQTLFLLTPVISSTFASVGRLLRDMKSPGCIGTLIIDEAGQTSQKNG